jgi:hypothetical protein
MMFIKHDTVGVLEANCPFTVPNEVFSDYVYPYTVKVAYFGTLSQ